ncbi:MAG: cytochrome c biogenesis protein ResB [Hydrogenophilales bacterium]|nr:cytochrome c biogenesis protein ResB [Hydrogenophilales bacterium]
MTSVLRALASPRFTLVGMALLGATVVTSYIKPVAPEWWLLVALALLALNLACALLSNARLRRGGLLVFHLALLTLILLIGAGRLMRFDGRAEIVQGSAFTAADAEAVRRGPLHPFQLQRVHFVQGPLSVDYVSGLNRSFTRSHVFVRDAEGQGGWREIGDDKPLVLEGYRFYTTPNKGFAPLITWMPEGRQASSGTLNMPSYPLFDWEQANRWTPPGGPQLMFKLRIKTNYSPTSAWVFDGKSGDTALTIISGGTRFELKPGETARLPGGSLRFDELRTWMGYSIFYDPTLPWLFAVAVTGVGGLAWHYWRRSERHQRIANAVPSGARSVTP